ncbi:hypothetical protein L210DRAFT_3572128, partial [Boletus edulis BED1]
MARAGFGGNGDIMNHDRPPPQQVEPVSGLSTVFISLFPSHRRDRSDMDELWHHDQTN